MLTCGIDVSSRGLPQIRGAVTIACVLAGACGPSASPQADLAEVCGQEEPAQILALHEDEAVGPSLDAFVPFDDGWLVAVQRLDRTVVDVFEATASGEYRVVPQLDARVEAIDRCGNDRRVVAEGIDAIFPPRRDGEPWLGYRRDTEMLFVFDPTGAVQPLPLGHVRPFRWTVPEGNELIVRRRDERDLVRFTLEAGGAQPEVLATSVAQTSFMSHGDTPPHTILVLHDDGDLVELALDTGQSEPILQGVRMFSEGSDRRWLAWTPGDPATPPSELATEATLLDRSTGEQRVLASGEPLFVQVYGTHLMVEVYDGATPLGTKTTMFMSLPGGEAVTLEGRWMSFGGGPDGRIVVTRGGTWPPEAFVYAPIDGVLREVAGPVPGWTNTLDALWYDDAAPYADLDAAREGAPYDLVRFDLSSLKAQTVQHRIWSGIELPGDRWVGAWGLKPGDPIGELVIVDGADGSTRRIARDVAPVLRPIELEDRAVAYPRLADEVVYEVRDPGSDGTGLWRAAFPDP